MIYSEIYVALLKQSSYKNAFLLSLAGGKQKTYFSKKYSKANRISLHKNNTTDIKIICKKDNIKAVKYIHKKINSLEDYHFVFRNTKLNNVKIIRYFLNNGYNENVAMRDLYFDDVLQYDDFSGHIRNLWSLCACVGNIRIIRKMLARGYTDTMINILVEICSQNKGISNAKWLLLNTYYDMDYLLTVRVMFGDIMLVKLLLDLGANPCNIGSALLVCIINNNIDMVKLLLDYGANANSMETFAETFAVSDEMKELIYKYKN